MTNQTAQEQSERKLFYSIQEASKILGIGQTYVFRELKEGRLKKVSYGRRTLIPAGALQEWAVNLESGAMRACK